jgi:hypothetical protein
MRRQKRHDVFGRWSDTGRVSRARKFDELEHRDDARHALYACQVPRIVLAVDRQPKPYWLASRGFPLCP